MATLNTILARARVIATQMGGDPNVSPVIDNKAGLRALVDNAFSSVYKKRAATSWRDVSVRHTISVVAGVGALPATVLRECIRQADFETTGSLISYIEHDIDDRQTFNQLGYVKIRGDNVLYTPPGGGSFTGDLFMTAVSVPEYPADPNDDVPMTAEIFDDVCMSLALGIRGELALN